MKTIILSLVILLVSPFASAGSSANPDTFSCRAVCQKVYETMANGMDEITKKGGVMDIINQHYGRGSDITTPFQAKTNVVYAEINGFYAAGLYEQQMVHSHCFHGSIPWYGANTNQIAFVAWLAKTKPRLVQQIVAQCK